MPSYEGIPQVLATIAAAVLFVATPALAIGSFSPSVFRFVTTLKDDGQDDA